MGVDAMFALKFIAGGATVGDLASELGTGMDFEKGLEDDVGAVPAGGIVEGSP